MKKKRSKLESAMREGRMTPNRAREWQKLPKLDAALKEGDTVTFSVGGNLQATYAILPNGFYALVDNDWKKIE